MSHHKMAAMGGGITHQVDQPNFFRRFQITSSKQTKTGVIFFQDGRNLLIDLHLSVSLWSQTGHLTTGVQTGPMGILCGLLMSQLKVPSPWSPTYFLCVFQFLLVLSSTNSRQATQIVTLFIIQLYQWDSRRIEQNHAIGLRLQKSGTNPKSKIRIEAKHMH